MNFILSLLTRANVFILAFAAVIIVFYLLKILFVKKGKGFFSFLYSVWLSIKKAIVENSDVKKFVGKHKKFFQFLRRRLDKNNFWGLPLTVFLLALIYAIFLFGGIIEDIIKSDIIVAADVRVANLLAIFRDACLVKFFFWITLLGKWQIVAIFTLAVSVILWIYNKRTYILPLLLSIVGSELFTLISKQVFHRPRPSVAVYAENSFSFPSGHATIAVAFYGFITYLLIKKAKKWNKKINVFFVGIILVALIGFSRLYLGVHYVSDVWGGYLVGAIWMIIAISLSEYLLHKKQSDRVADSTVKKRSATIGIICAAIIVYIIFAFDYHATILAPVQKTKSMAVVDVLNIFKTEQLKYTETLLGNQQEPISFAIVAKNDQQFVDLFARADWILADNINFLTINKMARAALWKEAYPTAPMTPDFWDAKVHDFGFEKSTATNSVRVRHHARFWKTNFVTENGDAIYVGTASFDSGIKWGVTHKINPDIDTEREFLFNDLQKNGAIKNVQKLQFVNPVLGKNFSGDQFFTDGKAYLILIK